MGTKIALQGREELIAALNRLGADVQTGAADTLKGHGRDVAAAIRAKLPEDETVSKPGEAPHTHTGGLAKSIGYALRKAELGKEIVVSVFVRFSTGNGYYGHMLEYGTSKIAARPFFWPTIKALAPNAKERIDSVIKKAVRRFNVK